MNRNMLLQFSTQFPQIIVESSLTEASINRRCQLEFHRRRFSPLLTAQARRPGSPLALAKTPILPLSFLSPAPFCLSPRLRRPSCPQHAQRRHDARLRPTCFAPLGINACHICDAHCSPRAGQNRPIPPRQPAPLGCSSRQCDAAPRRARPSHRPAHRVTRAARLRLVPSIVATSTARRCSSLASPPPLAVHHWLYHPC